MKIGKHNWENENKNEWKRVGLHTSWIIVNDDDIQISIDECILIYLYSYIMKWFFWSWNDTSDLTTLIIQVRNGAYVNNAYIVEWNNNDAL